MYNPRFHQGFTMAELLVVMGVIGFLFTVSAISFGQFSKNETLQNATLDVATMLNLAKSRAQTQVQPSTPVCVPTLVKPSLSLNGYSVKFDRSTGKYALSALCNDKTIESLGETSQYVKKLPTDVTFAFSGGAPTFKIGFTYLTGKVIVNEAELTSPLVAVWITSGSTTKTITVTPGGTIQALE